MLRNVLGNDLDATNIGGDSPAEVRAPEARRPMPSASRSPSIIEMRSPYWQQNEIIVYQGVPAQSPEHDLLIGDVVFQMSDGSAVFGLLVNGDRLLPHVRDGKLMKLAGEASARIDDLVLIVQHNALNALFGRLSKRDGGIVSIRRCSSENDVQVMLGDRDALFRVMR